MSAKAEQKERTHASILASAAQLVREKGVSGARVADVMKGAGLTVGGFYAHFASKEALIDDALRRTAAETRSRIFQGLDAKPPADRAEVVVNRYLSVAHRDDVASGCPLPAVVGEVATTAGEHRAVLAAEIEAFAARLESYLPAGGGAPRRMLALGLVALMVGGLSLARALRGTPLSDEIIRACRRVGRTLTREVAKE